MLKRLVQYIFSVTNVGNHKVVTILGIKLKFRNLNYEYRYMINSICLINKNIKNIERVLVKNNKIFLECESIEKNSLAVVDKFYGVVNGVKYSPIKSLLMDAHQQTMDFIKQNMDLNTIILKDDRISNLKYALSLVKKEGLFLEFGVYSGSTINIMADMYKNKQIFGFDSFEGLPENWNGWSLEESFFKTSKLPKVRDNIVLVKGWFNEVLPGFMEQHREDVAFLHVDCDIYSSAKYVLDSLAQRIKPGTIILFDEYFNYPNWQNHEHKAFMEFIETTGLKYRYVSIGHDQVTVEIL